MSETFPSVGANCPPSCTSTLGDRALSLDFWLECFKVYFTENPAGVFEGGVLFFTKWFCVFQFSARSHCSNPVVYFSPLNLVHCVYF